MNPSFDRQGNRLEQQCQNRGLLIYYWLEKVGDSALCELITVLTQEHFPNVLNTYHLEREIWKKGNVLAVLWARKLRTVAVTILLHHPLRQRLKCLLFTGHCTTVPGAGSQWFLSLCRKRLWQRLWTASAISGLWYSAIIDATFPESLLLQEKLMLHVGG